MTPTPAIAPARPAALSHAGTTRPRACPPPRRTAFLALTTVFSGGDKHLVELLRRADRDAVEPLIFCFGNDVYSEPLNRGMGLDIPVATGLDRRRPVSACWRLRRARTDTVVFVTGEIGAYPWFQFLAARCAGARRVYAIYHNVSETPAPPRGRGLLRLASRLLGHGTRARCAARVVAALSSRSICVSRAVRDRLITSYGFPADRTETVLNGVDLAYLDCPQQPAHLRRTLGVESTDLLLVAACRLVPVKGVEVLLRAMAAVRQRLPNLKCVVVGDGPSAPSLRAEAARLGLDPHLRWVGFQPDVRPYLHAADVFVNPSSPNYVETLPLAVLEAMACGRACIASQAGGGPEMIDNGTEGLLVPPGDVDRMSEAIACLASDPATRTRMGERARAKVQEQFEIERCMRQIWRIIGR